MSKHEKDYNQAIEEGKELDQETIKVQNKYDKVNVDFQNLSQSVSFLKDLEFYQAAPDIASLKIVIESLEKDISSIGVLPEKEKLAQIWNLELPVEEKYLRLLSLRKKRLRQLVETLQQRIKNAEQRLESASVVIDQFGSIQQLLEKTKKLEEENDILKVRQVRFSVDSLLKPRRLTRCEIGPLQAFLIALQNELAVVRSAVSQVQKDNEEAIRPLPDETELSHEILKNPSLIFSDPLPPLVHTPLDLQEISAQVQKDNLAAENLEENLEIKLIQIDNQYAALKEKNLRLKAEQALRKKAGEIAAETGRSKIEKLTELNEKLNSQIQILSKQYQSAEFSRDILQAMLTQVSEEKESMKLKSAKLSDDYNKLFADHCALREVFQRTWKAGAGLFKMTELFSKAYMIQVAEPSEFLNVAIAFSPKDVTNQVKPDFTEIPPVLLTKFFEDCHIEMLRNKAKGLVDAGQGTHVKKLVEVLESLPPTDLQDELVDVIHKAPEVVLGKLMDTKVVSGIFEDLIDNIRTETKKNLDSYSQYLNESLTNLRRVSDPILCKIKRAMSSQTFQARKTDIETQYNKADLPRGGVKKTK